MRILFVTNRYPTADHPGDSPCIQEQERALQALGHQVDVLVIRKEEPRRKYPRAMWSVFQAAQVRKQYDIVHAHYGYCGLVARMQWRCPAVVTFRGSDVYVKREARLGWLIARIVDQAIVMTEDMKDQLGVGSIQVIPYGIDTDLFKPEDRESARQQVGLPMEKPLVLFPYDPRRRIKRFDLVEQAVQALKRDFPDVQVVTISDKSHEDVARYMNACDAMVLTSDSEGAPVAVREALACNLPIVSVDVGDVAEVLGDTEGSYIVARDPSAIAAKLALVLRDRRRTNGRSAALKMSIAASAESVAAVYERLLRKRAPQPTSPLPKWEGGRGIR